MNLDFGFRALGGGLALGLVVGAICFAGLWWGFQYLVKGQEEGPLRRVYIFRGIAILVAQLFLAVGLLFFIPLWSLNPISLAGGVVIVIFLLGLLSQKDPPKP